MARKNYYLKFTQTREIQDGSGTVFEEGETYPFTERSSVDHWLSRNCAVEVDAPKKEPDAKTTDPAKVADKE